jgi:hypothetical protein
MRGIVLALSILTGCIAEASAQSASILAVPATLSAALAEHGCVHIADDAEVLRNRDRWWVSLKPFTGGDADFAFYCQSATDRLMARLVLVVKGEKNPWRGCDAVVDFWHERIRPWFPYDLTVVNAAGDASLSDLSRWWLVSSSRNPKVTYGPAGVKVANPIIDTTRRSGGSGTLYACHSRQWYRIGLD